jgi:hypothetical protein
MVIVVTRIKTDVFFIGVRASGIRTAVQAAFPGKSIAMADRPCLKKMVSGMTGVGRRFVQGAV